MDSFRFASLSITSILLFTFVFFWRKLSMLPSLLRSILCNELMLWSSTRKSIGFWIDVCVGFFGGPFSMVSGFISSIYLMALISTFSSNLPKMSAVAITHPTQISNSLEDSKLSPTLFWPTSTKYGHSISQRCAKITCLIVSSDPCSSIASNRMSKSNICKTQRSNNNRMSLDSPPGSFFLAFTIS